MAPATFALLRNACIIGRRSVLQTRGVGKSSKFKPGNAEAQAGAGPKQLTAAARPATVTRLPAADQCVVSRPRFTPRQAGTRMALSEIEKLERRYAENPQGLTFAPLAEIHRKNGEVQRALDLLSSGLEHHPDYIPASIVLGRCHMDLGDVQKAESAFLHVLALDGENVIALKASGRCQRAPAQVRRRGAVAQHAADGGSQQRRGTGAAPAGGDFPASGRGRHLGRAFDARWTRRVRSRTSVVEVPSDVEAPGSPFEPPVAEPAVGWVSPLSGHAPAPPPIPMDDLEPSTLRDHFEPDAGIEFREFTAHESEAPPAAHLDAPGFLEEVSRVDSVEPLDGLVGREVDTPHDEAADELMVETSEDLLLESMGGSEFQMPDASQELFGSSARRGTRSVRGGRPRHAVGRVGSTARRAAGAGVDRGGQGARAACAPAIPFRSVRARAAPAGVARTGAAAAGAARRGAARADAGRRSAEALLRRGRNGRPLGGAALQGRALRPAAGPGLRRPGTANAGARQSRGPHPSRLRRALAQLGLRRGGVRNAASGSQLRPGAGSGVLR